LKVDVNYINVAKMQINTSSANIEIDQNSEYYNEYMNEKSNLEQINDELANVLKIVKGICAHGQIIMSVQGK